MAYATLQDVQTRLGRPIVDPSEVAQVEAWLADVDALILARLPGLPGRIEEGSPSLDVVKMVEANAVIRKILNPEGKVQEGIDDYSYRRAEAAGRGDLFLTDEEWDLLTPAAPDGAWTIRPYGHGMRPGRWAHPDVWVPDP